MANDVERMDAECLGPAMKALTPRHRAFVLAYFETDCNASEAGRMSGYPDGPGLRVTVHRIQSRPDVKAAMMEECRRRLAWDLPVRVKMVQSIADNAQHKDQLKANLALMTRGGLPDVTQVTHEHQIEPSTAEQLAKIAEIFAKAGLPLPEGAKPAIEAEYVEVNAAGKVNINGEEY